MTYDPHYAPTQREIDAVMEDLNRERVGLPQLIRGYLISRGPPTLQDRVTSLRARHKDEELLTRMIDVLYEDASLGEVMDKLEKELGT